MGPIVGTLRAKGYTGPIGSHPEGILDREQKLANGMIVSTSVPYLPLAPVTVRWRQEFETHHGAMDTLAALFGYAAAQLAIAAIARTRPARRGRDRPRRSAPMDHYGQLSVHDFRRPAATWNWSPHAQGLGKFTDLEQARPSTFMAK